MPDLVKIIEVEREALADLIAILDDQLALLSDPGADANYLLMQDILRYCCVYTPISLFRYEDALFSCLAEHDRSLAAPAAELRRRHERHAKLAEALHGMLEGISSGHMIPRDRLQKEVSAYLKLHREHLGSAEAKLLATAAERLTAADRVALAQRYRDTDLAPQHAVVDEFERLRAAIREDAEGT